MDIKILYQDEKLFVINKPTGVVTTRADSVVGETIQDWVENSHSSSFFLQPSSFASRAGIVHRLDKETSGCLIIAKNQAGLSQLQSQFKARKVNKEYLALVHGRVEPKQGTISVPLSRSWANRQQMGVAPGGRPAETDYQVIGFKKGPSQQELTLLRLSPQTGRTHQIRVHLKYYGHPIVADSKYGGSKRVRRDLKWCPRLFLHAAKITFIHPDSNRSISVEAPLPQDLKQVLVKL